VTVGKPSSVEADAGLQARETYDAFAPSYDEFNHRYQYESWTGKLLERAEATGLEGYRLLDVGCGTGLSFVAPLAQGWTVTGCDISPRMIERAHARGEGRVARHVADMRALPRLGEFDLIWAVNDAMNYLMDAEELEASLAGVKSNLATGGVILFDLNTLAAYRGFFSEAVVVEREGRRYIWQGLGAAGEAEPGAVFESSFDGSGEGVEPHTHRQRHFGSAEAIAAIGGAGLECVELSGELDSELSTGLCEERHTKAVYVCKARI
jgi:SAM-dependent methyltransferase